MTVTTEYLELLMKQAKLVIPRLEKITPDSSWAHQASGCRGWLIRLLEIQNEYCNSRTNLELTSSSLNENDLNELRYALERSFDILERVAVERIKQGSLTKG